MNFLFQLLEEVGETPENTSFMGRWGTLIFGGVLVLLAVAWFVLSGRKNKRSQQEYVEQLQAIAPGNKVKTAGGICGIVVEVCDEDNTVIIETGSEQSGKSYVKMDKEMIAQTDAKGPTQIAREKAEAERKAKKEGIPAVEANEAPASEESPASEEVSEEATASEEVSEENK